MAPGMGGLLGPVNGFIRAFYRVSFGFKFFFS